MNRLIKDYFSFSRSERNGILLLFILFLIVILIRIILPYVLHPNEMQNPRYAKLLAQMNSMEPVKSIEIKSQPKEQFYDHETFTLFPFNPNTISDYQWQLLGLENHQVRIIRKYLASGASFHYKEDLKKIYKLPEGKYWELYPYINLPTLKVNTDKDLHSVNTKKGIEVLELNTADSSSLVSLPGIGPVLAVRIIKYRKLLGGYISKDQLLEVFGIDLPKLQLFQSRIIVDSVKLRKININTSGFNELKAHPYLDYYKSKAIIEFRKVKGKINYPSELLEYKILKKEEYQRIASYLAI
jgi:competence protein ComEA